ncbi:hypothetical protein ABPG74_007363 [Tetrahymena malaccensis]
MSLKVPIYWTFGQLMYVVYENHNQLKNYKFAGLKFMHSGSYVDEEDQIQKYQKLNQKEMILFLKVDVNVSDQVVEIQEQKIMLNQKYAINLLWESYVEKISPFAYNSQESVQEQNIQKQKLEVEILSSAFPLLHQQTEVILQSSQNSTQSKQPHAQRNQNQDNLQQDLGGADNFFARNIPIMLTIYFMVISKFDGLIYYALLATLIIYFFIKYQDHKHKMNNQIRERQEADQRQPNQQGVDNNQVNGNNATNININNNNNVANNNNNINTENRTNNAENQANKTENIAQANVNIELTNQSQNEIQNLDKNGNGSNSQNQNISFDPTKEININDNINNNQGDQAQDKKTDEQMNQQQHQENKKTKKKKQKSKGLVLLFLRIKEFIYCFVMSLFPLWYVDLYNKNHNQQNEEAEEEQKQEASQNQGAQQQTQEQNNQDNLNENQAFQQINQIYNRNANNQNERQNENNQPQQNGGLFDRLNNYLERKLKDLEEEEKQLRQTIKKYEEQQEQQDSQTKEEDGQQANEEKTDFEKKND